MAKYIFDTNPIISGKYALDRLPEVTYISSIVHFELITACNDLRERRAYESSWRNFEKVGRLIVPKPEDWLKASQISFALAQERKQQAGGKAPKLSAKIKQEIAMDCLLAVSAAREDIIVLTLNLTDFDYIKRHCPKLKVQTYPMV